MKWEWIIKPTRGNWVNCWYAAGCGASREDAMRSAIALMRKEWCDGVLDCPPDECRVLIHPVECSLIGLLK